MLWTLVIASVLLILVVIWLLIRQQRIQKNISSQENRSDALRLMQQQLEGLREQMQSHWKDNSGMIQKQLEGLHQHLHERLTDSHQLMSQSQEGVQNRLDRAAKVIGDLQGKLGKLEEANTHLFAVGKDIHSLHEILKTPKLRGGLGENFLTDLLTQILPQEHFTLQYAFKNNEKVDAVIRLGDKLVSVDSKFPLENFQRYLTAKNEIEKKNFKKTFVQDVKKHMDAINKKYIRPDEGTYDFALMYVPAENIYYEVIVKDELADQHHILSHYGMKKRVIPVSPNTLYVYLHTIVLGLKGLRIEKEAQGILNGLSRLTKDLGRIEESFRKTGVHLHNAQVSYEDVQHRLGKFGERMERLQGNANPSEQDSVLAEVPEAKVIAN